MKRHFHKRIDVSENESSQAFAHASITPSNYNPRMPVHWHWHTRNLWLEVPTLHVAWF